MAPRPATAEVTDPFQGGPADLIPFNENQNASETPLPHSEACGQPGRTGQGESSSEKSSNVIPVANTERDPHPSQPEVHRADFQLNASTTPTNQSPFADDATNDLKTQQAPSKSPTITNDPCAAVPVKPFTELGINIAQPAGKLPADLAATCWEQINHNDGSNAASRAWPLFVYQWEATCLCYQPLYFEEANLERYGYQCGDRCCCPCECCVQPFASAAHFFGTVPLLPYCMAADCPGNCNYTLGNYRPGNCNPLRWQWPPFEPLAAVAYGGFWVGMATWLGVILGARGAGISKWSLPFLGFPIAFGVLVVLSGHDLMKPWGISWLWVAAVLGPVIGVRTLLNPSPRDHQEPTPKPDPLAGL